MTSTATPGPWIHGAYGEIWVGIHRNADGKWDEDSPDSAVIVASATNPADRPLIAAAPAMREALRKIADLRDSEADDPFEDALSIADKALALAAPAEDATSPAERAADGVGL